MDKFKAHLITHRSSGGRHRWPVAPLSAANQDHLIDGNYCDCFLFQVLLLEDYVTTQALKCISCTSFPHKVKIGHWPKTLKPTEMSFFDGYNHTDLGHHVLIVVKRLQFGFVYTTTLLGCYKAELYKRALRSTTGCVMDVFEDTTIGHCIVCLGSSGKSCFWVVIRV